VVECQPSKLFVAGSIPVTRSKYMNLTEQLIYLAKEVESTDPIDWGMLNISEDETYNLLAGSVLEQYLLTDNDDRDIVMLSVVLKLTVENFVLNLKLMQRNAL